MRNILHVLEEFQIKYCQCGIHRERSLLAAFVRSFCITFLLKWFALYYIVFKQLSGIIYYLVQHEKRLWVYYLDYKCVVLTNYLTVCGKLHQHVSEKATVHLNGAFLNFKQNVSVWISLFAIVQPITNGGAAWP